MSSYRSKCNQPTIALVFTSSQMAPAPRDDLQPPAGLRPQALRSLRYHTSLPFGTLRPSARISRRTFRRSPNRSRVSGRSSSSTIHGLGKCQVSMGDSYEISWYMRLRDCCMIFLLSQKLLQEQELAASSRYGEVFHPVPHHTRGRRTKAFPNRPRICRL